MGLTEIIANFILQSMSESDGVVELQRRELADQFGCVPSQINYVLDTRFSPNHGYMVETRRGGGGFIRITRVSMGKANLMMHAVNAVGDEIDLRSAQAILSNIKGAGALKADYAELIYEAIGDSALRAVPAHHRDALRAGILKQLIIRSMLIQNRGREV